MEKVIDAVEVVEEALTIEKLALERDNIAKFLSEQDLCTIANTVRKGYEIDKESRAAWDLVTDKAMEIARQDYKQTELGKANVKYPLITMAGMQFAARTYPEVIRNSKVVNAAVVGRDDTGEKEQRARRISDFMSWQLLVENEDWEPSLDRLLHLLPIVGTVFKKVYYDSVKKQNCSELCLPDEIFVNHNIQSLSAARRVTHKLNLYINDIIERIRAGIYCDIVDDLLNQSDDTHNDPDAMHCVLEQHTYLDLDKDGYREPYIVTLHLKTNKILRIIACFDMEKMEYTADNKIKCIPSVDYFVDYHFIPSPDGKFYSLGFGQILYPLNESVNTIINQLIDAGTRCNLQSGFLGSGFRGNPSEVKLKPSEWKRLDIPGEDIAKNVYPLPVKEPSPVLFELLGFLTQTVKEVASVTDVLQGQQPAQNVPATTVLALIEQGLKLYSSLQKRLFRSLTKEFRCLYRLNAQYMDPVEYYNLQGISSVIAQDDFVKEDVTIFPVSDPSLSSDAQRLARAEALMKLYPLPQLTKEGRQAIMINYLDALQTPMSIIEKISAEADPSPSEEMLKLQLEAKKMDFEQQNKQIERQIDIAKASKDGVLDQLDALKRIAEIKELEAKTIKTLAEAENADPEKDLNVYSDFLESIDGLISQAKEVAGVDTYEEGRIDPMANDASGEVLDQPPENPAPEVAGDAR